MDWLIPLAGTLKSLPWPAIFVVVIITLFLREGITGILKLLGFWFGWQKYKDAKVNRAEGALIRELKDRIDKLETEMKEVRQSNREERAAAALLLRTEQAAHAACLIDREQLRGDVRVMKEQIGALQRHEVAGKEHAKKMDETLERVESKISESGIQPLPPEIKKLAEEFKKKNP